MMIDMHTLQNYSMMWQSGMHGLDDVGSKPMCDQASGTYTSLMLNLTHLPAGLISGVCLPPACSQEIIDNFSESLTRKVNYLLVGAFKKLGVDLEGNMFVQNFTRVELSLTQA